MENKQISLPEAFEERMKVELEGNFEKYLSALKETAVRGIRVNTKKISTREFCEIFGEDVKKLEFSSDGYELCSDKKTGEMPESLAGLFYSQEPSSMIPVCASRILEEKRPLKILDLCASPGGKSGQIACRISDDSILFSNEIISSRAEVLYSNIERQGFKNVVVLNEKPENLEAFEHYFDYVFVDAPCSGEGMFRKNPETISEWSDENVKLCANRQKDILEVAKNLVAPNGKLIYSTCTFSRAEDEEIVEWFLKNSSYELVDVPDEIKIVTAKSKANVKNAEFARKFYPFTGRGEGQFVAVFKMSGSEENTKLHIKKHFRSIFEAGLSDKKLFEEFVRENFEKKGAELLLNRTKNRGTVYKVGEYLYLAPEHFNLDLATALDELRFLSLGVRLGKIQKDRFEPNHALFMAYGELLKIKIELDETQLKKYLHGEELMTDLTTKGYAAITAKGYAIGGARLAGGRLKNLYPKGLRI